MRLRNANANDLVRPYTCQLRSNWLANVYVHQSGRDGGIRDLCWGASMADVRNVQADLGKIHRYAVSPEGCETAKERDPRLLDPYGSDVSFPVLRLRAADTVCRMVDEGGLRLCL